MFGIELPTNMSQTLRLKENVQVLIWDKNTLIKSFILKLRTRQDNALNCQQGRDETKPIS